MTALGNNAHIFARPSRRAALRRGFEALAGPGSIATLEWPASVEPMLIVHFPAGGTLSIEFTEEAPDDDHARLSAWLEIRAEDPAAAMRAAIQAGLSKVTHPGHPFYVMAPGGQVFAIAEKQPHA